MTRRFFYTDPLAAAWMAKHFKMDIRIDDPDGKVFLETTLIHGLREWRDAISASTGYKFYIHPDSLHLLDPRRDDLVTADWYEGTMLWEVDEVGDIDAGWVVLRRSNKPFHWPECEKE